MLPSLEAILDLTPCLSSGYMSWPATGSISQRACRRRNVHTTEIANGTVGSRQYLQRLARTACSVRLKRPSTATYGGREQQWSGGQHKLECSSAKALRTNNLSPHTAL